MRYRIFDLTQSWAYFRGLGELVSRVRVLIKEFYKRPLPYHNEGHVNQLLNYVNLEGKTLLIVGLGRGAEVPVFLAEGCRKVIAVEPYPIVDEQSFGPQFELVNAFGESIPIEAETFDVAYTVATLEHVRDPDRVVKEVMRLLKPGGILYCSTAPLWFSAYGYHAKKRYPGLYDPWFHLIYSKEDYISKREDIEDDTTYSKRLNDIYDHPGYNRLPSQVYYDIAIDLIKHHFPLRIEFTGITKFAKLLADAPALYKKLKKYDLRDLITKGVTIVVRKRENSLQV